MSALFRNVAARTGRTIPGRAGLLVLALVLAGAGAIWLAGCSGGSRGDARASSWLGVNETASVASVGRVLVLPALPALPAYDSIPVAVLVTDASGRPSEDQAVTLTSTLGGSFDPPAGVVGSDGWLLATYTAGGVDGSDVIMGSCQGVVGSATLAVNGAGATPKLRLLAGTTSLAPGQATPLQLQVTRNGRPLGGAPVSLVLAGGGILTATSGTSDTEGWLTTTYTAPLAAALATVTVQVYAATASLALTTLAGTVAAPQVQLRPARERLVYGRSLPISVQVIDAAGSAANGVTVLLSATAGSFESSNPSTAVNGVAQTVWTAPPTPGLATLSATALGVTASATLTIDPGPGVTVRLVPGADAVLANATMPVAIFVSDDRGDPAGAATIVLTSSLDGQFFADGTTATGTGVTSASGTFFGYFTAGAFTGSCELGAQALGKLGTASVDIQ